MKRKVIQIAGSTQLISLPRKWALAQRIKKGDELDVQIHEDQLTVSKGNIVFKPMTKELDIAGMGAGAKKVIGAAYKKGYDEMRIRFSTPSELKNIQKVLTDHCVGMEIVEQGKNFVLAKKISKTMVEEFDLVLRRTWLLLITMGADGAAALRKKEFDQLGSIVLTDASINRFTNVCRRILNKSGTPNYAPAPLYCIIELLEKIGDLYKVLFSELSERRKVRAELIGILELINDQLKRVHMAFYKFDDAHVIALKKHKRLCDENITALMVKIPRDELLLLAYLKNMLDKIYDLKGPLLTLVA